MSGLHQEQQLGDSYQPVPLPALQDPGVPAGDGDEASKSLIALAQVDANIRNFAPVARIMKNALPENAKIAKEAKECMQECVSEFISFITSEGKQLSSHCHLLAQDSARSLTPHSILTRSFPITS